MCVGDRRHLVGVKEEPMHLGEVPFKGEVAQMQLMADAFGAPPHGLNMQVQH